MLINTPLERDDLLFGLIVGAIITLCAFLMTRRAKERNTIMFALLAKLSASLTYSFVEVSQTNTTDSVVYHFNGIAYANELRANLAYGSADYLLAHPIYWLGANNRDNTIALSGLLHVLLFDSFVATSFIFALLGFLGQLLIYKTFVSYYPEIRLRIWWRAGILFFPTLVFWSSGILKDSLGILGLGCVCWGVRLLLQQYRPRYLALIIFGAYTLFIFRAQIAPTLFIALIPWIVLRMGMNRRARDPSGSFRIRPNLVSLLLLGGTLLGFLALGVAVPRFSLVNLPRTIVELNSSYVGQQNVQTGVYAPVAPLVNDASWGALLRAWPSTLVLSLYRPFPWEAASLTARLASVENLILLALTGRFFIQLLIHRQAQMKILRSPLFLTCVVFVAIFAFGVGASTPNLGTVSRYRIPLIPFLVGAFSIAQYHVSELRDPKRTQQAAAAPLDNPGASHPE